MKLVIKLEWEIHDTRNVNGGFKTGTSTLRLPDADSYADAMNAAIRFAKFLPSWEFERNGIDLEEYREFPYCTYYYETNLTKILKIEKIK